MTGRAQRRELEGIEISATALTTANRQPAVWVFDSETGTVDLRNVDIGRHGVARVTVASGLTAGESVVTAGGQSLRPGQQVQPLGAQP